MQSKIETTLNRLVEAEGALMRLLSVKFDKPNGAKVRHHVVKLARFVREELTHFHEERNDAIDRFGEGDPKSVFPTSARWREYVEAINALGAVPVTIPWGPVTNAMVEPYPDVTASDLVLLGPLFSDDEEEPLA